MAGEKSESDDDDILLQSSRTHIKRIIALLLRKTNGDFTVLLLPMLVVSPMQGLAASLFLSSRHFVEEKISAFCLETPKKAKNSWDRQITGANI